MGGDIMKEPGKVVRLAAIADLHYGRTTAQVLQPILSQMNEQADVLLICGDLTDHGQPQEAEVLTKLLSAVRVPMVAVLGNHDYHAGKQAEVQKILAGTGVHVLQGDSQEVHGVGFAGVKGFGGGFGQHTLEPWGEDGIKHFVQEALQETLHLESGLARLRKHERIVLLHYAPIQATVEGEPVAIFPFLGSSRLEEPVNRYRARVVFHGHAHRGSPEGKTAAGIPVYNVSMQLLLRKFPDRPPFRLFEVPVAGGEEGAAGSPAVDEAVSTDLRR
jgi:Icc-related predicted phosphoesterase